MMMDVPLYLLYTGQSEDGRGTPRYYGCTKDAWEAQRHWKKCQSPYSNGKVVRITESTEHVMTESDWIAGNRK